MKKQKKLEDESQHTESTAPGESRADVESKASEPAKTQQEDEESSEEETESSEEDGSNDSSDDYYTEDFRELSENEEQEEISDILRDPTEKEIF